MEKRCTKCGEVKSLEEFCVDKTIKSGRSSRCKECRREYLRKWREKNRGKLLERSRQWVAENPEKRRETVRKSDAKNAKKRREKARERYAENRERLNLDTLKRGARNRKNLSDVYVRQLMTKRSPLLHADIPQELVEAKRVELKIKRYLREQSK
jgi:predicted  nucleic acid-binding Zn-ribbon protein